MKTTTFQLPDEQLKMLQLLSKLKNVSQGKILRQLVTEFVEKEATENLKELVRKL